MAMIQPQPIRQYSKAELRILVPFTLREYIDSEQKKLKRGSLEEVATRLGIKYKTVEYLWGKYRDSILNPEANLPLDFGRKKSPGRPLKVSLEELYERVKNVPFSERQNYRTLAIKVKVSRPVLQRAVKNGMLLRTTSSIKPLLTDVNKLARVAYCKSFVGPDNCFLAMLDRVDIDEKWFYITRSTQSYIIVPGETIPNRTCKHKSHIEKVMCLTAVACPRQNPSTGEWWDMVLYLQKIAQRTTKNRKKRN